MKQTRPLTDEERVRLRQSLGLNGRSFQVTVDGVERCVSFELTRKQDTAMKVLSGESAWWLREDYIFVRRVRLDEMQTPWDTAVTQVEPSYWWTYHARHGGNKILPLAMCFKLEQVFQLALAASIEEVILS